MAIVELVSVLLFGLQTTTAQRVPETANQQYIRSFDVEASIDRGDDLLMKETIVYENKLQPAQRFTRFLPALFIVGTQKISTGIEILGTWINHQQVKHHVRVIGDAEQIEFDPQKARIYTESTYQLVYRVQRSIVEVPQGQRLSWNIMGGRAVSQIREGSFTLDAPVVPQSVNCFVGSEQTIPNPCTVSTSGTRVTVVLNKSLEPGQEWIVEIMYPLGTFLPAAVESAFVFPWLAPWMGFSGLFVLPWAIIWLFFGRDARAPRVKGVCYTPPPLKPHEVNALANDGINHQAMAATIIDLVQREYIRVFRVDGVRSYALQRTRATNESLDAFEQGVMRVLFEEQDRVMGVHANHTQAHIYEELRLWGADHVKQRGWHQWNPVFVRGVAMLIVCISWGVSFFVLTLFVYDPHLWLSVAGLCIGLVFAHNLPKRSREGAYYYEWIKAFERYMHHGSQGWSPSSEAPARTADRFHQLLPQAVALGAEEGLCRLFMGVLVPSYLNQGSRVPVEEVIEFAHRLSDQCRMLVTAAMVRRGMKKGDTYL